MEMINRAVDAPVRGKA
jgi:cold shock protein